MVAELPLLCCEAIKSQAPQFVASGGCVAECFNRMQCKIWNCFAPRIAGIYMWHHHKSASLCSQQVLPVTLGAALCAVLWLHQEKGRGLPWKRLSLAHSHTGHVLSVRLVSICRTALGVTMTVLKLLILYWKHIIFRLSCLPMNVKYFNLYHKLYVWYLWYFFVWLENVDKLRYFGHISINLPRVTRNSFWTIFKAVLSGHCLVKGGATCVGESGGETESRTLHSLKHLYCFTNTR